MTFDRKKLAKWVLPAILVLAAGLRLIGLGQYPASLYWEEVALGYDAYSILKTGKDYHGNSFPIVAFESFGDFKPVGYFYAIVPIIAVFGLEDYAVRLPAALTGIGTVWLVYLLVLELKGKREIAWLSALSLAVIPWHIQFSRAAFEVTLATFLLTLGVFWLLKGLRKKWYMVFGTIALVLSMYTYHGLRILAPLMGLLVVGLHWKSYVRTKQLYLAGILAVLLVMPLMLSFRSPAIQQRFTETSMFSVSSAVPITNQLRTEDGNDLLSRLVHHRYWYWGKEMLAGGLSHLDPAFLFIDGDHNPRHQTGTFALMYWWMAIPLLYGLFRLTSKKYSDYRWLVGWVLLALIPIALTKTTPHTLRFLPASPALAVLIGLGLYELWVWIKKSKYRNWLAVVSILVIVLSLSIFVYDYTGRYRISSTQHWQYGYRQLVDYLSANESRYEQVYITREHGRPSMYLLYYMQIPPHLVQLNEPDLPQDQGELLAFDRYLFGLPDESSPGLWVSHMELDNGKLLKTINFLDGTPAFYIYEI